MRANIGDALSSIMEDAVAYTCQETYPESDKDRFHARLIGENGYVIDIRKIYAEVLPTKVAALAKLVIDYENLPA